MKRAVAGVVGGFLGIAGASCADAQVTNRLSDSFEGHALARLVCATGSEQRFSPAIPPFPGNKVEDPGLWGWAMTEQMAEMADVDDVRHTALAREIGIASGASPHMRLITACATTRIALMPDRADPKDVATALAALRAAGPLAVGPLRHVLAEIDAHPEPASYAPFVALADALVRDPKLPAGDRVGLAIDLFALSGRGVTRGTGKDYEGLARAAAGSDVNQQARFVGHGVAIALQRAFDRAHTSAERATWAKQSQAVWGALRGQLRPDALDDLTRARLRALLFRISDELPVNDPSEIWRDATVMAPKLDDVTDPVWSRRVIDSFERDLARLGTTRYKTLLFAAKNGLPAGRSLLDMELSKRIVSNDAAIRDKTAIYDWRRRTIAQELDGRQLVELDALAANWTDRREAAIDMQLKIVQIETRSGAALAAAEGIVRRAVGGETAKPGVLPPEIAPFEFQLNFAGRLRRIAAWGETLPQAGDGRLMAEIRAAYLLTSHALPKLVYRLSPRVPGLESLVFPLPVSLARMQSRLAPGEVAVIAFPTLTNTLVIAFSRTDAITRLVPLDQDTATARVTKLRASIVAFERDKTAPYAADTARVLFDATLGQATRLLESAKSVIWIGFGPYGAVPPAILMDDRGFAIERYQFSVLTSLEELDGLQRTRIVAARQHFVGIGGAELDAADLSGGAQSLDDAPEIPLVPGRVQGAELVKLYQIPGFLKRAEGNFGGSSTLLLGRDSATEAGLRKATAGGVDVLVFGSHGLLAYEGQFGSVEPMLVLAPGPGATPVLDDDGRLRASEVAQLGVGNAQLIVLAACNTAGSDGRPTAEALSGLSRAFRAAGASNVVASHWSVLEDATAGVLSPALADAARGVPLSQALRRAMLASLHQSGSSVARHPGFWGAYVVVGPGDVIASR